MTKCQMSGTVCGHDGETYNSECAALAARTTVDYMGVCQIIGDVSGIGFYIILLQFITYNNPLPNDPKFDSILMTLKKTFEDIEGKRESAGNQR